MSININDTIPFLIENKNSYTRKTLIDNIVKNLTTEFIEENTPYNEEKFRSKLIQFDKDTLIVIEWLSKVIREKNK